MTELQSPSPPGLRRLRHEALVLGGFVALALLLTWPLVLYLGSAVIGYEHCTNRMHVWVLWVVKQLIFEGYIPTDSNYVFYPNGVSLVRLYGSDLFYPVVLSPLSALLSPGVVFNAKVLFSFTLAPYGVYRLLRHLDAEPVAAWVGGALFIATPYFLLETFNGVSELLAVEWVPFAVLFLLRSQEDGKVRHGLLAALFVLLSAYASGYNVFFLLFFGLLLLGYRLLANLRGGAWRRAVRPWPLLVAGALSGVGLVPLMLLHRMGGTAESVKSEHVDILDPETGPKFDASADLERFFRPGRNQIPEIRISDDGAIRKTNTTYSVYLGYGILALALCGLILARPRAAFFGILAVFFVLLCLGPVLRVAGERIVVGSTMIPLPAYLFYKILPGFEVTVRHTYRYVAMAHLGLAVMAGLGLAGLLARLKPDRRRTGIALGLFGLCLGEVLAIGPSPWPLPRATTQVDPIYHELARDPEPYPIIELPYSDYLEHLQPILMAQTIHGKKLIAGAVHHRITEQELALVENVPLAANFMREDTITEPLTRKQIDLSLKALKLAEFRLILVRDSAFQDPTRARAVHLFLQSIFGPPERRPGGVKLYMIK